MHVLTRSRVASVGWPGLALVLAAFLLEIGAPAQPAAADVASVPYQSATTMNTFVIVFRQGPRTLTPADIQQRGQETSVWARRQNEAGHKLDPHILTPARERRGSDMGDVTGIDAWPITALLFLEARDLAEAAKVAAEHPAVNYGANVEVRPWAAPTPVAPPPKTPDALWNDGY
jgi:hypothetical protein